MQAAVSQEEHIACRLVSQIPSKDFITDENSTLTQTIDIAPQRWVYFIRLAIEMNCIRRHETDIEAISPSEAAMAREPTHASIVP